MYDRILKSETFLSNRTLIGVSLGIVTAIHVSLGFMVAGLLSPIEVLSLLYATNILMLLQVIDFALTRPLKKKEPTIKKLGKNWKTFAVAVEHDLVEQNSYRPNLFIENWKKTKLDLKPVFPLDRLAYLNAMFYHCSRKHFFFLRNTHLKQLARKEAPKPVLHDECHPMKLVTDLFSTYIHRRALYYRSRNVCAVNKRQYTKVSSSKGTSIGSGNYEHDLLYSYKQKPNLPEGSRRKIDYVEPVEMPITEEEISSEESLSDDTNKSPRNYFRKLTKVFSSAVGNIKGKKKSSSERVINLNREDSNPKIKME